MKKQLFAMGMIFAIGLKSDRLIAAETYLQSSWNGDIVVTKTSALKQLFPRWAQKPAPAAPALISTDEIELLLKRSNTKFRLRFKSAYASCQTEKQLWTLATADNTKPNGYTKLRNQ